MHKPGRVVILNGPSSSGKSSIARRLQELSTREPLLHIALDTFRAMEPPQYWSEDCRPDWPRREEALCRAMNATAAAYAMRGLGVVMDHVLPSRAWQWIRQDLLDLPVLAVGIHCEPSELARRERARGDRPIGLGCSQIHRVHAGQSYDFALDTTALTAEEAAQQHHAWLCGVVQSRDSLPRSSP